MRGKRGAERRTLHIFPVRPLPAKRTAHGPEFPRRLILAAADGKRLWGSGLEGVLKARVAAAISAATADAASFSVKSARRYSSSRRPLLPLRGSGLGPAMASLQNVIDDRDGAVGLFGVVHVLGSLLQALPPLNKVCACHALKLLASGRRVHGHGRRSRPARRGLRLKARPARGHLGEPQPRAPPQCKAPRMVHPRGVAEAEVPPPPLVFLSGDDDGKGRRPRCKICA